MTRVQEEGAHLSPASISDALSNILVSCTYHLLLYSPILFVHKYYCKGIIHVYNIGKIDSEVVNSAGDA